MGSPDLSLEDQARTVLHLVLQPVESSVGATALAEDALTCPNCAAPTEHVGRPYCSEACRDQAAFVRQIRSSLSTGTLLSHDRQTYLGERLWWLLGGGLPLRDSRIGNSGIKQVLKRCSGQCEFCGKPYVAIQNFGSGCNRPLHLRAVCEGCAKTKPFGDPDLVQRGSVQTILTDFRPRVHAASPLRICDDSDTWDWQSYLKARRSRLGTGS